jgi:transposase
MSGQRKKTRGKSSGQLSTLNEHAAGLDVGSTFHVVAVQGDQDEEPVRTFRSFSGDLHKMADWLKSVGIKTVAMESTSVYWIPVFEILEARGFDVLLVNARDVKNVPGRKTDVNDAQWLQQLHQHGLLRGSFRPRDEVVRLRARARRTHPRSVPCRAARPNDSAPRVQVARPRHHATRSSVGAAAPLAERPATPPAPPPDLRNLSNLPAAASAPLHGRAP